MNRQMVMQEPNSAPLRPYIDDPQSPNHRIERRMLLLGVVTFCLLYGFVFAFFAPYLLPVLATPVFALAAAAMWALPDVNRAPTRALEGLFFAFFAALILWPNYLAIAVPGLPWITLIRLAGFPLAGVLLICVSTSAAFRARLGAALSATPYIWRSLVAFVAIQALSIMFSDMKSESVQKFILAQVYWTSIFFISCYVFLQPKRVEQWSLLLWIMAIPIGLIGIAEHFVGHVLWATHIPSFLRIADENVDRILHGQIRAYTGVYRIQSTFSTSLGLAEYIALTIPFVIHFAFLPNKLLVRALAIGSIPFLFVVILFTGARLGVVGFGLSFIAYVLIWAILKRRREPRAILASAILYSYPVLFGATVATTLFIGRIRRLVWGGGEHQLSNDARTDQLRMGMPMVISQPWGHGIGRGAETLGYSIPGGLLTIDTYYLMVALEYGIIGFVVYFGMILVSIYYASMSVLIAPPEEREFTFLIPAAVSLFNFLVIKSIFSQQDNHPLAFMMMGMVAALVFRIRTGSRSLKPSRGHPPSPRVG
jgi:hypothetical protein